MAGRSLTKDVLDFLTEVDETMTDVPWSHPAAAHAALLRLWKLIGALEATALRRANRAQVDQYTEDVLLPRARRAKDMVAELVPMPRTDKDGVPW